MIPVSKFFSSIVLRMHGSGKQNSSMYTWSYVMSKEIAEVKLLEGSQRNIYDII